jgi:hypothetical protein
MRAPVDLLEVGPLLGDLVELELVVLVQRLLPVAVLA